MKKEQQESLDRGINLFNDGRYFDAHEEWEHEWRLMGEGDDKRFFQGLIMTAASLHHYQQRECRGASEMLRKGLAYLPAGMNGHTDIGVGELIDDLRRLKDDFDACSFNVPAKDLPIIHRNLVTW